MRGKSAIKQAIVVALDAGAPFSVECSRGDHELGLDAALYVHFRIAACGVRLFVKVFLDTESPDEPDVRVISVKRDDQAWK